MPPQEFHRDVLLATGAKARLDEVAGCLMLLDRLLTDPDGDRELVLRLRQTCLTEDALDSAWVARLTEKGFLDETGRVPDAVRDAVKAAVRGEGRNLHLVSPYVSPWDRTLSDLFIAQQTVAAALPPDQAAELVRAASGTLAEAGSHLSWVSKLFGKQFRDGNAPPPHWN